MNLGGFYASGDRRIGRQVKGPLLPPEEPHGPCIIQVDQKLDTLISLFHGSKDVKHIQTMSSGGSTSGTSTPKGIKLPTELSVYTV